MTGYQECPGCHLLYVDTGCEQNEEHAGCPHPCAIDGRPITYDETVSERCEGHSMDEAKAFLAGLRSRSSSRNGHQGE